MSQLRSCYFCGAVGDSLREYEVVPERLVSPDGSRSAVLCSSCHEKLRRVLEPFVDAAEATAAPEQSADSLDEVTFDAATSDDSTATTHHPESAAGDGESDATIADADTVPDGERPSMPEDGDADAENAVDDDEPDGADERADATDDGDDLPDDYYKVLRLLQNREFPMERADLTALVTGAYDVSDAECERILETAIERGVLVEDGATLDVGRN